MMGLNHGARITALLCILAVAGGCDTGLLCQEHTGFTEGRTPLGTGERLVFGVQWIPPWYLFFLPEMQAGEAEVALSQEFEYEGTKALKITFLVHSSGAFANLVGMKIDDAYEYFTNAESFCTIKATRKIREGKRKRDIEVVYLPERNQLHILDVDLVPVPHKERKNEYKDNIPQCVRDLFSALYWVRSGELRAGLARNSVVGNDDKVKEVRAIVEKKELVDTPMGKFMAWRLNTVAILGGLFKDGGQFRFWLTDDDRRLPVQFEAKVSLGKVSGKLKAVETAAAGAR